ncbi:MAG TPA: ribonuclease III, partial [Epsilonproteobacteria bacterium]|nr:ribonuclease III [Campylobacterota bacterium]
LTQATHGVTPSYELIKASGPDHLKEFVIAVTLNGETIATANGRSKKSAQQKAAQIALKELKDE